MKTKERPLRKEISAIVLFFVISILVSFSQKSINTKNSSVDNKRKPQIENADSVTDSGKIMTFHGNVKIRIPSADLTYSIIKTDSAIFDKEKNIYSVYLGTVEKFVSGNTNPIEIVSFDTLRYNVDSGRAIGKNINGLLINEKM